MEPGLIRVAADAFPLDAMPCLRCGTETPMRFLGPCAACAAELREKYRGLAHEVEAEYVPKMNVTPNAVA
ncbi:MAG TPA: hypothetical protein VFR41_06990, partial [Acidimicrobiia bacterium]|nr:hypothetical protein [Acidimicrobiia bacterium]